MSIGWSKFALERHVEGSGNSFFTIPHEDVIKEVEGYWSIRRPGAGETGIDRKVLVAIRPGGFFLSTTPLKEGLPLKAHVTKRQEGEDLYVETYIDAADAKALGLKYTPAQYVDIVCYHKDALLENNGERSTDCEWEIVAVLAREKAKEDSMPALTMARNFLEKPGGTKSIYTAKEFAEAIYEGSGRGIKIKKVESKRVYKR